MTSSAVSPTPLVAPASPLGYTVAETAQALRISRSLLYKLWATGDGPPRRRIAQRRVIVPAAALEQWLVDWESDHE